MRQVGISGSWCEVEGEPNGLRTLTLVFKCKCQTRIKPIHSVHRAPIPYWLIHLKPRFFHINIYFLTKSHAFLCPDCWH